MLTQRALHLAAGNSFCSEGRAGIPLELQLAELCGPYVQPLNTDSVQGDAYVVINILSEQVLQNSIQIPFH